MSDAIRVIIIVAAVVVYLVGAFLLASRLFGPAREGAVRPDRNRRAAPAERKPAVKESPRREFQAQTNHVTPPAPPLPDPRNFAGQLPDPDYSRQLAARVPRSEPGRISYGSATGYVDMESYRMPPAQGNAAPQVPAWVPAYAGAPVGGNSPVMRLTIIDDNGAPAYFVDVSRDELPVIIGRGRSDEKGKNIVVNEPTVSFKHALISVRDGVFYVRDCCSTCGTVISADGGSVVLRSDRKDVETAIYAESFELMLGKMGVRAELAGEFRREARAGCVITLSASYNGVPVTSGAYCDTFTIGRQDAGFTLADPKVSRTHAVVTRTPDGQFVLRDQNSKNGIYSVAGEPIAELQLRAGMAFVVGDTRVQVDSVERGTVRPAEPARPRTVYYDSVSAAREPRFI